MRRRFFVSHFDFPTARLTGDSAHHLARVLRASPGQLYELSDGSSLWVARIDRASKSTIDFSLVEQLPVTPDPLHLTLLLSIVKFDRFEWALEKATELGVAEIVPLAAARSERALISAAGKRAARWHKMLLESAQQSRRLRPPLLHPAARAFDVLSDVGARHGVPSSGTAVPSAAAHDRMPSSSPTVRLLLSERPSASTFRTVLDSVILKPSDEDARRTSTSNPPPTVSTATSALLAIGPEGGWTDDEFSAALSSGFREVSLGPFILRTETAVIAALSSLRFALSP